MQRLLTSLLLAAALPATAGQIVDVSITNLESGTTLPAYPHAGRDYVAGSPGHRYAVTLVNRTGGRVLAVLSVDGVNAVSGETANPEQSGYVLGPWERAEIRGWRKSLDEVADFVFTSVPDSYAARTGRPRNVGVIGVAAFRERYQRPIAMQPLASADAEARRDSAAESAPAPAAPASAAAGARAKSAPGANRQELGTGHGQRRHDPATYTAFERESRHANEVLSLYYDATEALVSRGIIPRPCCELDPQAFPQAFVPDPPAYRRWR